MHKRHNILVRFKKFAFFWILYIIKIQPKLFQRIWKLYRSDIIVLWFILYVNTMHTKIKKFFTHMLANHSILFFAGVVVIIVLVWTIAFHTLEWRDFFNSFYFTTVTMSTIGYGDMAPLTQGGKIASIIYGFMGAPLFIWLTGLFFQSKFQHLIKKSIHSYHMEIKEAEKMTIKLEKENRKQNEVIQEIEETIKPNKKSKK